MTGSESSVHIVIMRLRPGTSREGFLDATRRMADWLQSQPGFLGYELYEAEDHWADRLEWASTTHAEKGRQAFLTTEIYTELIRYVADDHQGLIGRRVQW
ncbi:hypothetical protein JS756_02735 [Streptomyces actuosus]|uniref:ABM domain-containing protein n=1 Tax=Streptomyces actuosus TaxID=1885 RepID=A0ABS2VIY5_STRAS|nr:hypothetical protein [Streptomyces actuosus]MBN0043046.1 hypothetical protein [Streptomyces actuosus]